MTSASISARPLISRRLRAAFALALAAGAMAAAPQARALTLYDDFSGTSIAPNKWLGSEFSAAGASNTETRRLLNIGMLRLEAKTYGDNTFATGLGHGGTSLTFVRSADVTDIRATITPRITGSYACPQSNAVSSVSARLEGTFFNAGGALAGSRFNDVVAGVMVYRLSNSTDASGVMRVAGYYALCLDNTCSQTQQIDSAALGTVAAGVATQIEVRWDKANHRFGFQQDGGSFGYVTYSLSDTRAPQDAGKRLSIVNDVANCVSSRVFVYGGADFDDVSTNALP